MRPYDGEAEEEVSQHKSEIDKYIAELGHDGADFAAFKKLCINRGSLNPFRRGRFTRFLCCRAQPFDTMMVKAKERIRHELDIVRYIKKQRMHTNLLWGLSTKWQRSLCRNQAQLLIQDKLESEFGAFKLKAVRRLEETVAWQSSDSDDPLDARLI